MTTRLAACLIVSAAGLAASASPPATPRQTNPPPARVVQRAISHQPVENAEPGLSPVADAPPIPETDGPIIQLALLLDTSNSMDGLITQAKAKLWAIVNEMNRARCEGQAPQLQVALYEYGNDRISGEAGHVRRRVAFTTDLDLLSEQLFSLRTDGGQEYCGWVIRDAVRDLGWITPADETVDPEPVDSSLSEAAEEALGRALDGNENPMALALDGPVGKPGQQVVRMVVIAGNEPFSQGTVPYRETVSSAAGLGLVVNTIFCGNAAEGEATGWAEGAQLGGGRYASIDQNQSVAQIETPFDGELLELNGTLNSTYLAFGAYGTTRALRQAAQDEMNLALAPSAMFDRAESKAGSSYDNRTWDLLDALAAETVELGDIPAEQLPEELKGKTEKQQFAIIETKRSEREQTQTRIRELSAQRAAFIAEHEKNEADGARLDDAILGALREQLTDAGFEFVDDASE